MGDRTPNESLPPGWMRSNDPELGVVYESNAHTSNDRKSNWTVEPTSSQGSPPTTTAAMPPQPSVMMQHAAYEQRSHPNQKGNMPAASIASSLLDRQIPSNLSSEAELSSLTAGQIADLCFLQRQKHGANDDFGPLRPHELTTEERPPIEPARLETRMYSLYDQLQRLD